VVVFDTFIVVDASVSQQAVFSAVAVDSSKLDWSAAMLLQLVVQVQLTSNLSAAFCGRREIK